MPQATYGDVVKARVKRLFAALLSLGDLNEDNCGINFRWDSSSSEVPKLIVQTTLRHLESLTKKDGNEYLTKTQIREALQRMEDFLEILVDNRSTKRGTENWSFTLTPWFTKNAKNLEKFDVEWSDRRPEKSKQQVATTIHKAKITKHEKSCFCQELPQTNKVNCTSVILNLSRPNINQFKGREPELLSLTQWLNDPAVRLITITAAGGYGKSTLASKLYDEAIGFDGKFWVYFDQPYSFGQWGRRVLTQIGQEFSERLTDEHLSITLVNHLSQGRYLVVLDNLETLLENEMCWQPYVKCLQALCESSGDSCVLITSRVKPKESFWLSERVDVKGLSEQAALNFLGAMKVQGIYADLQQFVTLADCHPLLLKLTVEWLRKKRGKASNVTFVLSQQEINLFDDVAGNHRGDPEASIGKVLEQSVSLLALPLQHLWQDLSVYRQYFGLVQAKAMQSEATEKDLRELARYALLQEEPTEKSWEFSFLPLLQRFAQQRVKDQTKAHRRAILYFTSVAKPDSWETLEDIKPFLEIFHHHCKLHQYAEALNTIYDSINYDKSIEKFLDLRSYNSLRIELYSQLIYNWKPISSKEKIHYCSVLRRLGDAYYFLSKYDQAIELHQKALVFAQEIHDYNGEAYAFGKLSNVYYSLGNYQRAIECDHQFLKISQEIGSDVSKAYALGGLGNSYHALGNYQKAIENYQRRLEISQSINDSRNISYALSGLGNSYYSLGQYQQAIEFHKKCLEISKKIGDRRSESYALAGLSTAYHALNQDQQAINFSQVLLNILREIGWREEEGNALINLGDSYYSLGNYQQSKYIYEEALNIGNDINNSRIKASSLNKLGKIYCLLEQYLQSTD